MKQKLIEIADGLVNLRDQHEASREVMAGINDAIESLWDIDLAKRLQPRIIVKMEGGLIQYVDIPESLEHVVVEVRDFDMDHAPDQDCIHMMEEQDSIFYGQEHTCVHWKRENDPRTTDECQSTTVYTE